MNVATTQAAVLMTDADALISVADVAMDARTGGADAVYTYRNTVGALPGCAVMVPLGPRQALGFVLATRMVSAEDLGFSVKSLRPIQAMVDSIQLPPGLLALVRYVADSTLTTSSSALTLAVPPGIKDRLMTGWKLRTTSDAETRELSTTQRETIRVLQENQGELIESKQKPLTAGARKILRQLKALGLVEEVLSITSQAERHRLTGNLRLSGDEAKIEKFLTTQGKKKPAQAMVLMQLQGAEATSFTPQEIKALSSSTDATLIALVQAGLLEKVDEGHSPRAQAPTPNQDQKQAIDAITAAIDRDEFQPFLLYGVTGSGKTEVYMRAAEVALRKGKQVLILVPEIALTAQVIGQLRSRFGKGVAILHSSLPIQERLANWLRIASGEAAVVLGARSALFAPVQNLGLIVVDEEHEGSYKQESNPKYHARESALFLAEHIGVPIVLGSATPSIESYYRAQQGEFTLLTLPRRTASAQLPSVAIQDLTELYKTRHPSLFSPQLRERMDETLARGEQIILFLNRRAYAPFLMCRECGHSFACPQCAVSLAYHKRLRRLRCHHCGHEEAAPDICPACGGEKVAPFGVGAEKVEEAVRTEFDGVAVARLDRDVAQKRGALEETLALFRSQAIQVLVGTQMVAKGLDFPNVTLVGVIAADVSLHIPDFRASERTFQLLSQVAGRAGRGARPGQVVIQTLSPQNIALQCAMTHDYETIYAVLLAERKEAHYPPFCKLVNVVFSGESAEVVKREAMRVQRELHGLELPVHILGPVECPLERLHGLWRFHVLLKLEVNADLQPLRAVFDAPMAKDVTISVDVNPYSLM